jgi:hypothetical protein
MENESEGPLYMPWSRRFLTVTPSIFKRYNKYFGGGGGGGGVYERFNLKMPSAQEKLAIL